MRRSHGVLEDDEDGGLRVVVFEGPGAGVVAQVGREARGHRGGMQRPPLPLEEERPRRVAASQEPEGVGVHGAKDSLVTEVARGAVRRIDPRDLPIAIHPRLPGEPGQEPVHARGVFDVPRELPAARPRDRGLLRAHIRGVSYWAAEGHYNDHLRQHIAVAKAMFSHAACKEPGYLLRHLEALAAHPVALGPVLHDLSELATYDAVLRDSLPHVWPLVMATVLDAFDSRVAPRGDGGSSDLALAGLLPQPQLSLTDRDPETSLADASADWIDPSVLLEPIDRWMSLGRGSARCVDAMVGLVRTAAPEWQAAVGLEWVRNLIDDAFEPLAGRCFSLATWLDELRTSGHLDSRGRATLHRIVDGLASHGDNRAVTLQQAEE